MLNALLINKKKIIPYRRAIDETLKIPEKCWPFLYLNFTRVLQFSSTNRAYQMVITTKGAGGQGEQRRGLRTKALMRDLGTRLECRHRVFASTGKHCGNKSIVAQPDSNLLPLRSIAHCAIASTWKIVGRYLCYHYHYM